MTIRNASHRCVRAGARTQAEERPVEADAYSLYELLGPETNQFHILYEVTAVDPGAKAFFNPIRKGSEASGESVRDRATGQALRFEEASGDCESPSRQPRNPDQSAASAGTVLTRLTGR